MKNLEELREEIDKIDKDIVKLFESRMAKVEEISKYKRKNNIGILNQSREEEVLRRNKKYLKNKNLEPYLEEFYIELMRVSKDYQKDGGKRDEK